MCHVIALQLTSISSYLLCSGEAIIAFATPTESNNEDDDELVKELRLMVRTEIGPFAAPDVICIVSTPSLFHSSAWLHLFLISYSSSCALPFQTPSLPMTRSGKIMRRVLRKISAGEADQLGDVSTLADPSVVDVLIELIAEHDA